MGSLIAGAVVVESVFSWPGVGLLLAVLALFGNSPVLLICLLGLHAWEGYARTARGLAISAGAQSYAAAVRELGTTA